MQQSYHNFTSLTKEDDEVLQKKTLVFSFEDTLSKSSSMFPYFMLVAFEGGGPLRALILLLVYPFLRIIEEEIRQKIMVFICFFGLKEGKFRIGRSVLPKFFLENVGHESLEVVMRFGKRVAVTNLPRVMVEGFLMDFLDVEGILGREIKVFGGYYSGLLDNKEVDNDKQGKMYAHLKSQSQNVGLYGENKLFETRPFTYCKDIYLVTKDCKKSWNSLPREKYPKPLIFHDGRLAFMPTPLDTLIMFVWLPFGIILSIVRILVAVLLPYKLSTPILAFIGLSYAYLPSKDNHIHNSVPHNSKGMIYICNHKMVLDPMCISHFCRMNLTVFSYSASKFLARYLSPIDTIELTRERKEDAMIMYKVLSQRKNIIVCPEGTTCREPYLLRFSPLFAELSDDIIPVALEVSVSMFYGTTASGIKAFDPFFFMMNPWPSYHVKFLDKLPKEWTCGSGGKTRFQVANYVQHVIGKELGYTCTRFTRKDKYMVLAGNDGLVH